MIDDREWCRRFIDDHCVFRSPPGELIITSPDYSVNAWQFYMPIACLNPEFAERVGRLFWQGYGARDEAFQLCGCESGGSLLVSVLQGTAPFAAPGFMVKKAAKTYGLKNWIEGVADPALPVLLIEDVVGSGKTINAQEKRLTEFGFKIAGKWAIVACKANVPNVGTLFDAGDFARLMPEYTRKYGQEPEFYGTIA